MRPSQTKAAGQPAGAPKRLRGFDELAAAMRRQRARAAADAARQAAARREALQQQARERREREAFALTVGPVTPLRDTRRASLARPKPPPQPLQRFADERAALQASLSDEVDVESLLLTDDGLSFRRPGIGADVLTRLRRGHWALQSQVDLHGLRSEQAREALAEFLREATRRHIRCVRVVHGKGHGSPGRQPVLKAKVQRWLAQRAEVVAFAQASAPQGGAGALIVLLKG